MSKQQSLICEEEVPKNKEERGAERDAQAFSQDRGSRLLVDKLTKVESVGKISHQHPRALGNTCRLSGAEGHSTSETRTDPYQKNKQTKKRLGSIYLEHQLSEPEA